MTRIWAVGVTVLLTLTGGVGCVSCGHQACKPALEAGPACDLPSEARNRVYVFLLDSSLIPTSTGLTGLRDELAKAGFVKVGVAPLFHAGWVTGEVVRTRERDPDARFVLVGYDSGGPAALTAANEVAAKGIAVDVVVLVAPAGESPAAPPGVRTVVVTGAAKLDVPGAEVVAVPGVKGVGLAGDPGTVAAVVRVANEVAAVVEPLPAEPAPLVTYPYASEAWATPPFGLLPPEWDFLAVPPGPHTRPIK